MTEKARFVIGADGLHSLVACAVGASTYRERPTVACAYYTSWSGVSVSGAELYTRENRFIVAFPTNDNLVCNLIEWPKEDFPAVRADIEGQFLKALELAPGLAERTRGGQRAGRFVGTAELPNFFRKPYGLGWALVGDAGYYKDLMRRGRRLRQRRLRAADGLSAKTVQDPRKSCARADNSTRRLYRGIPQRLS